MPLAEPPARIVFDTDRLTVRQWLASDLKALLDVYGDAEAMRWVGEGEPLSHAEAVRWLDVTADNYRSRGYGMYAVVLRRSGAVVGFCGLIHPGGQVEAEVKYAFARACWGSGYATEAVRGLLDHGARAHALQEIIATVAAENDTSHRVMGKVGMRVRGVRTNEDGSLTTVYAWHPARESRGADPVQRP